MGPGGLYEEIGATLCRSGEAQPGKMFGMACLKVGGKAFAGLFEDCLVVKLRGQALDGALALEGAARFDPMGGRPMREWVQVPFSQRGHWPGLAEQALALQRSANG